MKADIALDRDVADVEGDALVDADAAANANYNAASTVQQTVTVAPPSPSATTSFSASSPPAATTGSAYSYTFVADGYPVPTYALASGTLPSGLTLSSSGVLSGTPTPSGSATFAITATNPTGENMVTATRR